MRSPSAQVLTNRVNLYAAVTAQDAVFAPTFSYPAPTRSGVMCSVQYRGTGEDIDTFGRITVVNLYHIMFDSDPKLAPRSMIVWTDPQPNRTLFVQSNPPSEAGRDSAWVVRAVEKV